MLTQFEVKRRVEHIRTSRLSPLQKVRQLLRIGKSLSGQVDSLKQAKSVISLSPDRNAAAGLTRMTMTAQQLHEEVREAAYEELHPSNGHAGAFLG